jgi:hypothetical protein
MMSSKTAKPIKIEGNPDHQKAWSSMRIMKQWSISAIVCTVPGASLNSIKKFVASLGRHGIVEKVPGYVRGRVGDQQLYRLYPKTANFPKYPKICSLCDQAITAKVCDPTLKKIKKGEDTQSEKEREKETDKERKIERKTQAMREKFASMRDMTLAEIEEIENEGKTVKKKAITPGPSADSYPNKGWHVLPEELKEKLETEVTHDAA